MNSVKKRDKFLEAYDKYSDAIFRHCYFRIFHREKAKDMMQDTFMRTWEYISKGNEVKNTQAFLYRVANNLIVDYSRKKKEVSLEELSDKGFEPSFDERNKMHDIIEGKNLIKLIVDLDDKHREIILMRYVDDFSPKEIAEILGETENNVSVRMHRAIKKIREKWITKD